MLLAYVGWCCTKLHRLNGIMSCVWLTPHVQIYHEVRRGSWIYPSGGHVLVIGILRTACVERTLAPIGKDVPVHFGSYDQRDDCESRASSRLGFQVNLTVRTRFARRTGGCAVRTRRCPGSGSTNREANTSSKACTGLEGDQMVCLRSAARHCFRPTPREMQHTLK